MSYSSSSGKPTEYANRQGYNFFMTDPFSNNLLKNLSQVKREPTKEEIREMYEHLFHKFDLSQIDSDITKIVTCDGGSTSLSIDNKTEISLIKVGLTFLDINKYKEVCQKQVISIKDMKSFSQERIYGIPLPLHNFQTFNNTVLLEDTDRILRKYSKKHGKEENLNLKGDQSDTLVLSVLLFLDKYGLLDTLYYLYNKEYLKPSELEALNRPILTISEIVKSLGLYYKDTQNVDSKELMGYLLGIFEQLSLFKEIVSYIKEGELNALSKILYIRDGPLNLFTLNRSEGKLLDHIQGFLSWVHEKKITLNLIGIEKSGKFVTHMNHLIKDEMIHKNEAILFSSKYVINEITGVTSGNSYAYNIKSGIRYNKHAFIINFATHTTHRSETPEIEDYRNFLKIIKILDQVKSLWFDNSIIPVILTNSASSISEESQKQLVKHVRSKIRIIETPIRDSQITTQETKKVPPVELPNIDIPF